MKPTIMAFFVVGLLLSGMVCIAGEVTMMSFNVRMGCGLNDPFKLSEGSLGHLPQCAEVIKSVSWAYHNCAELPNSWHILANHSELTSEYHSAKIAAMPHPHSALPHPCLGIITLASSSRN